MDLYNKKERERLSKPRQPIINAIDLSISRMATRSSSSDRVPMPPLSAYGDTGVTSQKSQSSKPPYRDANATLQKDHKVRFQKPPPSDILCKGCITYGHPVEECTKTGAAISIAQFLRNCPSDRKRQILEAYSRNRKEAHERYVKAYEKRRRLKHQIKTIEYDHQFDEENDRWKNLTVPELQQLEQMKVSCVIEAKKDHPDIDFGSLDENYADLSEPRLQFDSTKDKIPEDN